MCRVRRLLVWLVMLSVWLVPTVAQAETPIRLVVDGVQIQTDVAPVLEGNRVLVPIRAVTEALGFEVTWNGSTRTATLIRGDTIIVLTADKAEALVNGQVVTLDVPPTIRSDRMMVPVRFVAEGVGLEVAWDQEARTVLITSPEPETPPIVVDPAALALLEQAREAGTDGIRFFGDFTVTVHVWPEPFTDELTVEGYQSASGESLTYSTVRQDDFEWTIGGATYQGQHWSQDINTLEWTERPLQWISPSVPFDNPTRLANAKDIDLDGASVTLSQQIYEGTEMQVVTIQGDFPALRELLGSHASRYAEGRLEVVLWFNADHSQHHTDFHLDLIAGHQGATRITLQGTLYFEPWDQPIPFPTEITGARE